MPTPRMNPDHEHEKVSARFDAELVGRLREQARLEDRTVSSLLRVLARRGLDDRASTPRAT
jgi:predicted DNA-binding ribbon-helix-helix protein